MEYLIIWLLFGLVAMIVAKSKERSGLGWFLFGCFFGPFSLIVIALPSLRKNPIDPYAPTPKTHVRCPACKELILIDATVCKHCAGPVNGNYLPFGTNSGEVKTNSIFDGFGKVTAYTFATLFILALIISFVPRLMT
jgi:hypothetical protein